MPNDFCSILRFRDFSDSFNCCVKFNRHNCVSKHLPVIGWPQPDPQPVSWLPGDGFSLLTSPHLLLMCLHLSYFCQFPMPCCCHLIISFPADETQRRYSSLLFCAQRLSFTFLVPCQCGYSPRWFIGEHACCTVLGLLFRSVSASIFR